jgi:hypothetical protein
MDDLLKDKSEITRKTYISKLNIIKKKYFPDNEEFEFIKKPLETIKRINKDNTLSDSTKKLFYASLYSVSNNKAYHAEMINYGSKIVDEVKENKVKESKVKQYITYKQLKSIMDIISDHDSDIMDRLLIGLYVLQPPLRNDYAGVELLEKNKPEKERLNGNYMVMRPKSWMFYLNEFKNVETFGKQIYKYSKKFNPDIYHLLKISYELQPRKYLITRPSGVAMTDVDISKRIPQITKRYLNKELTINDIRKIYETNLINSPKYKSMSMKMKEDEHKKLLHSFNTAHTSYNKLNIEVSFD